ncbi:hypothetical protein PQR46_18145 [Paraburkholderia sediminicola]|uniref:hypothetical protein n=1 Tax=Paraburkholderia sediminicola TaxID=458836 RepID=UPI0038B96188
MNQLAHLDRDGLVAVVPGVIFSGTPSQIVNLPTDIKGGVGAIAVFAAYQYALTRWPVPWFAPVVALLAIAVGGVGAYLRTGDTPKPSLTRPASPAGRAFSAGRCRASNSSVSRM